MKDIPKIKPGDWLTVGSNDCVVSMIYPPDSQSGVCLVVFNKNKPTTHDIDWDGTKWYFTECPDFGGYAKDSDPFVQQLKRGRYT